MFRHNLLYGFGMGDDGFDVASESSGDSDSSRPPSPAAALPSRPPRDPADAVLRAYSVEDAAAVQGGLVMLEQALGSTEKRRDGARPVSADECRDAQALTTPPKGERPADAQGTQPRAPTRTPLDARFQSSPGWLAKQPKKERATNLESSPGWIDTSPVNAKHPRRELALSDAFTSAPGWGAHEPSRPSEPSTTTTPSKQRTRIRLALHAAAFDDDAQCVAEIARQLRVDAGCAESCSSTDFDVLSSPSDALQGPWFDAYSQALAQHDMHGNTALHIAVLRRARGALDALLKAGFPWEAKSEGGWTALDEAVGCNDFGMARALHVHAIDMGRRRFEERRPQLRQLLRKLPNMSFRFRWEFGSPILSLLLKQFAPTDTYRITKRGTCLRIDGTLRGLDEGPDGILGDGSFETGSGDTGGSLIPKWKHGPFSIVCRLDDSASGDDDASLVRMFVLDHEKKETVEMSDPVPSDDPNDVESVRRRRERKIDEEVRLLLSEANSGPGSPYGGVGRTKMKATNFVFEPVKSWMSAKERVEVVEGWSCRVFSATGAVEAVSVLKGSHFYMLRSRPGMTFEEYAVLDTASHTDTVLRLLPDSPDAPPADMAHFADDCGEPAPSPLPTTDAAASAPQSPDAAKREKPRKVSARCWMAEDFPFSLKELLPLLHIIGRVNRTIDKVTRFIDRYGSMDLFPVKLQVPIAMTVYLLATFRDFRRGGEERSRGDSGGRTWRSFFARGSGGGASASGYGTEAPVMDPDALPDDFFDIPDGYHRREIEEICREFVENEERHRLPMKDMNDRVDADDPGIVLL